MDSDTYFNKNFLLYSAVNGNIDFVKNMILTITNHQYLCGALGLAIIYRYKEIVELLLPGAKQLSSNYLKEYRQIYGDKVDIFDNSFAYFENHQQLFIALEHSSLDIIKLLFNKIDQPLSKLHIEKIMTQANDRNDNLILDFVTEWKKNLECEMEIE